MGDTPFFFLLEIALLSMGVMALEARIPRAFSYLPGIVVVYASSMLLSQLGWIPQSDAVSESYATLKSNLLPAMLFLLLLQIELRAFTAMGRSVLIAYVAALGSLFAAFVTVFALGGFTSGESGIFAALGGSWMGGTANMIAVAAAFHVSESALGYALVVDSFNYTLWVSFLLLLVPFAERFNRWSGAAALHERLEGIGCSCTIGPKRYWSLLLLSLAVALLCQLAAPLLPLLGTTTWVVLLATLLGVGASFTPLKAVAGSSELGRTMLYLLVALIGSQAHFESVHEVLRYLFAGTAVLLLHAAVMVIVARRFRLDLFSIAVASLANIGGVASAPLLAAAYDRALIGVAVLMAITGYLVGTFGGLLLGALLQAIAS